jgi:hypothetical protein
MENIREVEIENIDRILVKHIIIDHPDGSMTTMPKEVYDKKQAEQVQNPISVIPD